MRVLMYTVTKKVEKICFLMTFEIQTFKKQLIPLKVRRK